MKTLRRMTMLAISLTAASFAHAQTENGLGIGVIIGEPTGLSIKKCIGNDRAIDVGVAWSFSENASLHVLVDDLIHRVDLLS